MRLWENIYDVQINYKSGRAMVMSVLELEHIVRPDTGLTAVNYDKGDLGGIAPAFLGIDNIESIWCLRIRKRIAPSFTKTR